MSFEVPALSRFSVALFSPSKFPSPSSTNTFCFSPAASPSFNGAGSPALLTTTISPTDFPPKFIFLSSSNLLRSSFPFPNPGASANSFRSLVVAKRGFAGEAKEATGTRGASDDFSMRDWNC